MTIEANGVECVVCRAIIEDDQPDASPDCPRCEEPVSLHLVRIDPCEYAGNRKNDCRDDAHHFGRTDHVRTVGR